MQGALSRLRSWALDKQNDDIRGWAVRGADGRVLGTVDELIVDTDSKHVTQIVLSDGRRFAAHDLVVGDNFLTVSTGNGSSRVVNAVAPKKVVETVEKRVEPIVEKKVEPIVEKKAAPVVEKKVIVEKKPAVVEKKIAEPIAKVQEPARLSATTKFGEPISNVAELLVPIIEEDIEVGKRRVDTGGIHVESRIVNKPYDKDLHLREESVRLNRRKVDIPLSATDADARFLEGTVEVTAKSEYPIVEKKTHVVEEVIVNRGASERAVQLRDTVRRTDVEINEIPKREQPIFKQEQKRVATNAPRAEAKDGSMVIPVVDEELYVDKREYDSGGVRVTTRVTARPIDKTVMVREEHVNVQRKVVDRDIADGEDVFRDRALDLATYSEEPLITKRARVVEEILIQKDARERVEHVHDTLRHTDVRVSELKGERRPLRAYYEDHFNKNYAGTEYQFEAIAPAYQFGEDLRRTMPNADWNTIEAKAKPMWEAKNPGSWSRFSNAIKNGWERRG